MIIRGRELRGDVKIDCDAVVIGTGAGGSIALRELARAGLQAVALEQGGWHRSFEFDQREEKMLPMLFQQGGGRTTEDLAIRVLGGRGVGGSTIHNTNLCKRTPDEILDLWARKYGVENAGVREMEPSFAAIERDLNVTTIPDEEVNANNDVLRRGVKALGWKGGVLKHNRVGCQKSGFCELGCAYDAKENALKIVLPQAMSSGAKIYADVDARRVTMAAGRVTGVLAIAKDERGEPVANVNVRAKVVVLAGSAVGSAAIARRSGVPDPYLLLGRGLRMHPGAVAAGHFDRAIDGWRGIPQSFECTEHLSFDEGSDKRIWIVSAFAHPIGAAATLPGFGADHMRAMREYGHLAVLTAMLHDESVGEVAVDPEDGDPILRYKMIESDRRQLAKGLAACAQILFFAGAKAVTIPAIPPVRLTSEAEINTRYGVSFDSIVRPHSVPLSAVHPMGTMSMGKDPRRSVVSSTGEHHHVRGLFVSDGSLFPTSLGGPPQISIYAFALHLAPHVIARARAS